MRSLTDENFTAGIVRGLLLRRPEFDIVRVQDVGLGGQDDPAILDWAAKENRVLLTHDRATLPVFAYDRVAAGLPMAGVFLVNDRTPIRQAIEELLLIEESSEAAEWVGIVLYLPLLKAD